MKRQESGFTLIELVIVIVILGILAATALPRFINLQTDARVASVEGMRAAVRGASALAHAQWLADGSSGSSVTMEGVAVSISYGYPLTSDIDSALADYSGFNYVAGGGATDSEFRLGGTNGCEVRYLDPTGANLAPSVTVDTSNC